MSLVRLENITKTYAGREVLDSIDFRVEEGEHEPVDDLNKALHQHSISPGLFRVLKEGEGM